MKKYIYIVVIIGLILIGFFIGKQTNENAPGNAPRYAPKSTNADTIRIISQHTDTMFITKYFSDTKKAEHDWRQSDSTQCSKKDSVQNNAPLNSAVYDTVAADSGFCLHVSYFTSAPIDSGAYFKVNFAYKERETFTEKILQSELKAESGAWHSSFLTGFLSAVIGAVLYFILR